MKADKSVCHDSDLSLLPKDVVVNCSKVKVQDRYRKRYIWCLVNREEKIVIYCYEEGSRSRDVLKNILGDRQIRALQPDGYNVYMYMEDSYRQSGLTAEEITRQRNSLQTKNVIGRI